MIIKLFGDWRASTTTAEYSPRGKMLLAWLNGEPIDVTTDTVDALREEYIALVTTHEATVTRMLQFSEWASTRGSEHMTALDLPADPTQAWDAGYRAGAYHAYTTAAQQARAALSEAAAGAAEGE